MQPPRRIHGCLFAAAGCATSVIVALVLGVIVLRTTLAASTVPGINMAPTIAKGDRVIATRHVRTIRRGDVVAFTMPSGGGAVKRVIALPGEIVEVRGGAAIVNGVALHEPYMYLAEGAEPQIPVLREMPATRVPPGHYFLMGDNATTPTTPVSSAR